MAYKVIILYQLYMPSYFLGTFTEYPKVVMARKLVAEKGLQLSDQLSNNAYFEEVARQFQLSGQELTHLFWEKCNPSGIWVVILAMGFVQTYFSGYTID